MTDLSDVSDEELCRMAATDVMGWEDGGPHRSVTYTDTYTKSDFGTEKDPQSGTFHDVGVGRGTTEPTSKREDVWNPIENANHRDHLTAKANALHFDVLLSTKHRDGTATATVWDPRESANRSVQVKDVEPGRAVVEAIVEAVRRREDG